MSAIRFRTLAAQARAYADQLERIHTLRSSAASKPQLRSLARALVDEITAEQERRRRSRT